MSIQTIGSHIVVVDNKIEARITPQSDPAVTGVEYPEEMGYFDHPLMERVDDPVSFVEAVKPHRPPLPDSIDPRLRLHGLHHLHASDGSLADMAVTLIEREKTEQRLAFGVRPLRPSDYAVAIFWSRRFPTPYIYSAQRTTRVNFEAAVMQQPHEETKIGDWPALLMRWEAFAGAETLRARRSPAEFVVWFNEAEGAWISVKSQLPDVSATDVARTLPS